MLPKRQITLKKQGLPPPCPSMSPGTSQPGMSHSYSLVTPHASLSLLRLPRSLSVLSVFHFPLTKKSKETSSSLFRISALFQSRKDYKIRMLRPPMKQSSHWDPPLAHYGHPCIWLGPREQWFSTMAVVSLHHPTSHVLQWSSKGDWGRIWIFSGGENHWVGERPAW